VAALRDYVDAELAAAEVTAGFDGPPERAAGTSKTFRSLARLTGAAPSAAGPYARRTLTIAGLRQVIGFISRMGSRDLAELEGVSPARAHQLLAGAIVAEAAMRAAGLPSVEICPWALREGVILRRLDWLDGA
jgi:exopolyphosphatase/guanosine-5'-triphosphate,3'-diphosphate pyrophosphatase